MIQPRKVAAIGRINLVRQLRDRGDLFFVFVLPGIIIMALGLQFGGVSRARLGVVAPAGDTAAEALVTILAEDSTRFEIRRVGDLDTLRGQVERGLLEAGLVIPDGFSTSLGWPGKVELRYLGTTDALTSGLRAPIDAAVARLGAITTAARISVAEGLGTPDEAAAAAESGYATVPGIVVAVTKVGDASAFAGFGQFTFGASTQLVLFMFLTSLTAAGRLVQTKLLGLSRRMVSTPTSPWTIVTGEALGRYFVALLQAVVIVAFTSILFGVSWGDPLAAGALIAVFGLVAAGAAMLIGAWSRNADQASSLGVFVGLALAALGGCMIPIQFMPESMQAFSKLIPHSWALLGLQSLVRDGGGIESVATNLVVLAGFAVGLMGLAAWRFRKAIVE